MTEEFRAAFQRVLDTAAAQAHDFPEAVQEAFRLSSKVPLEELEAAMEALAPVLSDCEPYASVAADLSVLAGALVESGAPAGQAGLEVLRQVGGYGQAAAAFMHAWDKTGGGALPEPSQVGDAEEKRVEEVLGDNAPAATTGWWTVQRYGLAAKAMLSDSKVRSAVRADSSALEGLGQIIQALATRLSEFGEVYALLRMAEVSRVLVLDRASWRGFRVRFDGVGDNFQLHTLLADALIGKEGLRLPGTRPDPRWVVACQDAQVDPLADVVRGEWDLVGGDGTWLGNEGHPGDIPEVDGERVLVLEPQSLVHSWRAGRRHPHIPANLTILAELHPDEVAAWWARIHPAGSVRHPQSPPIEHDDTGTHRRPPRHFGVAAHFAEVDSGPLSAPFSALEPQGGALAPGTTPDPAAAAGIESAADPLFGPILGAADPGARDFGTESPEEPDDFPVPTPWAMAPPPAGEEPYPIADPGPFRDPDPFGGPMASIPDIYDASVVDGSSTSHGGLDSPGVPAPQRSFDPHHVPGREEEDGDRPPGSGLLPPMPPGVSDSTTWAPHWKWPMEPPRR